VHPFLFFLGTSLISVVCVALAIGLSWIAVVTSAGYLRILSFSGLPLFVSSLEGEVVCISGLSDILFLINHQGAPINGFLFFSSCFFLLSPDSPVFSILGEQCLGFTLFEFPKKKVLAKGRLPLTKGSQVAWIGFSEAGVIPPGLFFLSSLPKLKIFTLLCSDARCLRFVRRASWFGDKVGPAVGPVDPDFAP